jgi:uncharacterized protein DUF4136
VGTGRRKIWLCLLLVVLAVSAVAQKVKIGYDKGADFSKYKSYTWAAPAMPSNRPLLREIVRGWVDSQLKSKGLVRTESNGDLILVGSGGIEFGINQAVATPILPTYGGSPPTVDATIWTGASGPSSLMAPYVPEGSLGLEFVDRTTNKLVWGGTVSQKLEVENKKKSLDLIDKSIVKLLKTFPPKTSSPKSAVPAFFAGEEIKSLRLHSVPPALVNG